MNKVTSLLRARLPKSILFYRPWYNVYAENFKGVLESCHAFLIHRTFKSFTQPFKANYLNSANIENVLLPTCSSWKPLQWELQAVFQKLKQRDHFSHAWHSNGVSTKSSITTIYSKWYDNPWKLFLLQWQCWS